MVLARRKSRGLEMTKGHGRRLISFVSQKGGGVGKEHAGAAIRGRRPPIAATRRCSPIFDLEQLTLRRMERKRGMRNSIEPEIDARPFKSLKEAASQRGGHRPSSSPTRAASPIPSRRSSPRTATSCSCRREPRATTLRPRPWRSPASSPSRGADGRIVIVLSKVGRSEKQVANAVAAIEGIRLRAARRALAAARRVSRASSTPAAPAARRIIRTCARDGRERWSRPTVQAGVLLKGAASDSLHAPKVTGAHCHRTVIIQALSAACRPRSTQAPGTPPARTALGSDRQSGIGKSPCRLTRTICARKTPEPPGRFPPSAPRKPDRLAARR